MRCNHCGTMLPRGAIFCGECGRRVSAEPASTASTPERTHHSEIIPPPPPAAELPGPTPPPPVSPVVEPPRAAWSLSADEAQAAAARALGTTIEPPFDASPSTSSASSKPSAPVDDAPVDEVTSDSAVVRNRVPSALDPLVCEQCGAALAVGDIFCGECGHVSGAVAAKFTRSIPVVRQPDARPSELGPRPDPESRPVLEPESVPETSPEPDPEPDPKAPPTPEPASEPIPAPDPVELDAPDPVELDAPDPVELEPNPEPPPRPEPVPEPERKFVSEPPPLQAPAAEPTPPPVLLPPPASERVPAEDVEETRIVARAKGERFVLQFSTGETVTVHGSGLIGRNPRPEPGEFFDQLVRVLDTGRSVSKTHLEFGQDDGVLWIKDRYSGNGTVLRSPDTEPRRCEADKRYRTVRGSRVEIGEQFFIVS